MNLYLISSPFVSSPKTTWIIQYNSSTMKLTWNNNQKGKNCIKQPLRTMWGSYMTRYCVVCTAEKLFSLRNKYTLIMTISKRKKNSPSNVCGVVSFFRTNFCLQFSLSLFCSLAVVKYGFIGHTEYKKRSFLNPTFATSTKVNYFLCSCFVSSTLSL